MIYLSSGFCKSEKYRTNENNKSLWLNLITGPIDLAKFWTLYAIDMVPDCSGHKRFPPNLQINNQLFYRARLIFGEFPPMSILKLYVTDWQNQKTQKRQNKNDGNSTKFPANSGNELNIPLLTERSKLIFVFQFP